MSQNDLSSTWPTSPSEETAWQAIRDQYMIGPDDIYLNSASFGSQPRPVFECLLEGLQEVERNPIVNRGPLLERMDDARRHLGRFLNVPSEDLAFTINVTVAINMAAHGMDWKPGDEILVSDQEYGAIYNCLHHVQRRWGAVVRRAQIPIPPTCPEEVLNAFEEGFTERTRLVVCSHITTGTGLIAPIKALAQQAHAHDALILIDGAHGPGMMPLDLADYGCDFYGGNCHKWLCAPKGTGFLYVAPEVQERLHHIIVSWGYSQNGTTRGEDGRLLINNGPFMRGLEEWGTREIACFVAVSPAMAFQEAIGQEQVAARGRLLAGYLRKRMAETGWAELRTPTVPQMSGSISTFRFSGFPDIDVGRLLYDRYRITVPASKDRMRASTHICNGFDEMDRLVEALIELREEAQASDMP